MTVLERILELRLERGWSEYRLSEESGISQTTISSWFRKNVCPSVPSLEKICSAYGITLSQFFNFSGEDTTDLTREQKDVLRQWSRLSREQQKAFLNLLKTM